MAVCHNCAHCVTFPAAKSFRLLISLFSAFLSGGCLSFNCAFDALRSVCQRAASLSLLGPKLVETLWDSLYCRSWPQPWRFSRLCASSIFRILPVLMFSERRRLVFSLLYRGCRVLGECARFPPVCSGDLEPSALILSFPPIVLFFFLSSSSCRSPLAWSHLLLPFHHRCTSRPPAITPPATHHRNPLVDKVVPTFSPASLRPLYSRCIHPTIACHGFSLVFNGAGRGSRHVGPPL